MNDGKFGFLGFGRGRFRIRLLGRVGRHVACGWRMKITVTASSASALTPIVLLETAVGGAGSWPQRTSGSG